MSIQTKATTETAYCKNAKASKTKEILKDVGQRQVHTKTHPLHKPGRYKNFEQAAFSSLEKYESSVEGQVYVITNPNFPDWVKVGMAIDAEDRLNSYQTSSPFRDYVLQYYYDVNNRRAAENEAHTELQKSYERKGEWFKCTPEEARVVVSSTAEEYK